MNKRELHATVTAIYFAILSTIMFSLWQQSMAQTHEALTLNEQYYATMQEYKELADEYREIVLEYIEDGKD